jgi:hypothetical protein
MVLMLSTRLALVDAGHEKLALDFDRDALLGKHRPICACSLGPT